VFNVSGSVANILKGQTAGPKKLRNTNIQGAPKVLTITYKKVTIPPPLKAIVFYDFFGNLLGKVFMIFRVLF